MADLAQLKSITEKLSVLYVEDNELLLNRMGSFLDNIFKTVYKENNGKKGLESFKLHKPDIVITDLTMPIMTGHEMIERIKKQDPEANIIVLSAHSDTDNLLKSIHLGISDFIPKPIDSKLLQNVLFNIATKIEENIKEPNDVDDLEIDDTESLIKKLEILYKSHIPIEFINHYKGIPIKDKGYITDIGDTTIEVQTPFFQSQAIKYEGITMIDSDFLDESIEAKFVTVGINSRLRLGEFAHMSFSPRMRKELSAKPDKRLEIEIKHENEKLEFDVENVAKDSVDISIKGKFPYEEGEELELELNVHTSFNVVVKGKVFYKEKEGENEIVIILFELEDKEQNRLENYIEKRRLDLIVEFKQLKV